MDYDRTAKSAYPLATGTVGNAVDPSSSPVRDRIGGLESWLSDCHMALDNLEKRLDTITTPQPPQPASTNAAVKTSQVQSHVQGRL